MKTKIFNMTNGNGNVVKNQFEIQTTDGIFFQSYKSVIAFKPVSGKTQLDSYYWDYSVTTGKYRNIFLGENKAETEKKIKSGEYELVNLNLHRDLKVQAAQNGLTLNGLILKILKEWVQIETVKGDES